MGRLCSLILHLYLHIPYCAAKCPYCDFNSIAGREDEFSAYVDAILYEVRTLPVGPYATVFIGGGTPTRLGPHLLGRFVAGVRNHIQLTENYEWTCEANPGSADGETFAVLAEHGVNRLSLGVQSSSDQVLKFLGRVHDHRQAEAALSLATRAVPRVSADLMFGIPGQTLGDLTRDLSMYRRHGLQHASVYHLTYEPGTEFHARRGRGELTDIPSEASQELWNGVREQLAAMHLLPYETSNFATTGQESRHNMAYWLGADYHAAGAGAVSTVAGRRVTREKHPGRYITAITTQGQATWQEEILGPTDLQREAWMLGLRLRTGVSLSRLQTLGDQPQRWVEAAQRLQDLGLVTVSDEYIQVTRHGEIVLDAVAAALMP